MPPKHINVIVFGPTGAVGSVVAHEAHNRGAQQVWLAMRDPTKPLPLPSLNTLPRVQADLTDASSIAQALAHTRATAAYLYLVPSADDMQAAVQALRDGGVEHVVFLSSYSLAGADTSAQQLGEIPATAVIPYVHARVELALGAAAGGFASWVALRPGQFASNHLRLSLGAAPRQEDGKKQKAYVVDEGVLGDNIAPEDVGAVGGAVLVEPPPTTTTVGVVIPLCGPELRTRSEDWALIKEVTGRTDIDSEPVAAEEFVRDMVANKGLPRAMAEYVHESQLRMRESYTGELYREAIANVERYTGRKPLTFREYLERHKEDWQAA